MKLSERLSARLSAEGLRRSFAAFRIVEYRRWGIAQFMSSTGTSAAQVAMAWLVVVLGGDGITLGVVTACMMLPTLALGPVAGMLVDRFTRRAVLLATASAQALIAVALATLAFTGAVQVWSLMVLSLLHGLAFAADNPARQLLVLDLVGRDQVTSAVGMNEVLINSARIVGPAVAGLILVVGDPAWCFVFHAVSLVPAIVVLLTLRTSRPAGGEAHRASAAERQEPAEEPPSSAWRFVATSAPIRSTLLLAVCASASFNIAVVIPLIVADVFRAGGGTYGALAMAFGLGALPGAILSATGPTTPRGSEIRVLALLMGALVLLSAAAPVLPFLFAGLALVGLVVMWFIARANAFVMLGTPAAIRGRVMGFWAMALPGSNVVTGLLVGGLADLTDPRIAYAAVGLAAVATAVVCWRGLRPVE
ncbi:MAG: MFS transporter [Microbacterium sp.]